MSKKILHHPDKEKIIEDLNNGESVRAIEARLKEKYPNNKNLWVTSVTLQGFRKDRLKLDGKVLKDIQEAGKVEKKQEEEQSKLKQLQSSDAYNKKIQEIADSKLDVARSILQLDKIIAARMEYWYNSIASGEESAAKGDKELRLYMDRMMALLAQYKKFVEGMADKTVDYNININVMNEQISIIRDVIRECIAEMDSEVAMRFMDKLNKRFAGISYRPNDLQPAKIRLEDLQDAEIIEETGLVKHGKQIR